MPNKTIYVKDGNLWERAKKLAGKEGLSSVISQSLVEYVARQEREERGFQKYRLEVGLEGAGPEEETQGGFVTQPRVGSTGRISFEGRILVQQVLPMPMPPEFDAGGGLEFEQTFTLYRTRGGKLILTVSEPVGPPGTMHYAVYSTVSQLKEDPYLLEVSAADRAPFLDAVAEKTGEDWAVWIE